MWVPGLAESDAVTFFAVPPVSWLPEAKQLEIFEFSRTDSNTFPLLYITVGKVKELKNFSFHSSKVFMSKKSTKNFRL